jgi:hypothetical protein
VKIAAAPFIALSNVFGIDEKDLKQLEFSYSDTLLSAENTKKLDQLIMIRNKKPDLDIFLDYYNDRELERKYLLSIVQDSSSVDKLVESRELLRTGLVSAYLREKDSLNLIKLTIPDRRAVKNAGSRPVFEIRFAIDE